MAPCPKKNWAESWKICFTCSKKKTIPTRKVKKPLPIKLLKRWTWTVMTKWLKRNLSEPVWVKKPFQRCSRSKWSMCLYDKKDHWLFPTVDDFSKAMQKKTKPDFIDYIPTLTNYSINHQCSTSLFRAKTILQKFYMCHVSFLCFVAWNKQKSYFDFLWNSFFKLRT